jgi:hypothetical protein
LFFEMIVIFSPRIVRSLPMTDTPLGVSPLVTCVRPAADPPAERAGAIAGLGKLGGALLVGLFNTWYLPCNAPLQAVVMAINAAPLNVDGLISQ